MVKSFSPKEIVEYPNGGKSYFYIIDRMVIIVDEGICKYESEEDIRNFAADKPDFKALILAPNINIINDWHRRIEESLKEYKKQIEVTTFAYMVKNYTNISPKEYSYIVIDEAHHSVAPMLKRVIQYFTPEFMVGLTATDQRPDKKKLESVFGNYKTGLSLIQAMEEGIVAQANVYRIETNIDLSQVRFNGKDYINADLEKSIRVTSRNELIVNVLQEYFCGDEAGKRQGVIFLEERDYSLSYKMPFLLSILENMDSIGDSKIEDVLTDYIAFYEERIARGLSVDRASCPYNRETLKNRKLIKANMLTNPFEKFERKRFLYISKDLGVISMNHALFSRMEKEDFQRVKEQMTEDLRNYYKDMGI